MSADPTVVTPLELVGLARNLLAKRHPYYSASLHEMKFVERENMPFEMSTDKGARTYFNPKKAVERGMKYLPTFDYHEMLHWLRKHFARCARVQADPRTMKRYVELRAWIFKITGCGSFPMLFNFVGDLEINSEVDAAGYPWPSDFCPARPSLLEMKDGLLAEDYLKLIMERAEKMKAQEERDAATQHKQRCGEAGQGQGSRAEKDHGPEESEDGASEMDANAAERMDSGDAGAPERADSPRGGELDDGDEDDQDAGSVGEGDPDDQEDGDDENGRAGPGSDEDVEGDPQASGGGTGAPAHGIGRGCCGGCAGQPLEHEGVGDDVPNATEEAWGDVVRHQVAEAVREYASGPGKGDKALGGALRWANDMLAPPKIDPYRLLAHAVRGAVADVRARVDWKMGPPSRRREVLRGLGYGDEAPLLPVLRGPRPRVAIVVDTSGSMGTGMSPSLKGRTKSRLTHAISEGWGAAHAADGDAVGFAVDAKVCAVTPLRTRADAMKLAVGGGGTDMRVGVKQAAKKEYRADLILLFTDGETDWWNQEDAPRVPVVTVIVNENDQYYRNAPAHVRARSIFIDLEKED